MKQNLSAWVVTVCGAATLLTMGCSNLKAPAATEMALSKAALDNAASAGAAQYAPAEMGAAREKLARANVAMNAKDYELAMDLTAQAQADAKLAQSKANSAKAQAAADALQDDIRVLREELERTKK